MTKSKENKEEKIKSEILKEIEPILYEMENHISGVDLLWQYADILRKKINDR